MIRRTEILFREERKQSADFRTTHNRNEKQQRGNATREGGTRRRVPLSGEERTPRRVVHERAPFSPLSPHPLPPTPPPPRQVLQPARPSPRRLLVFSVSVPSAVGRGPRVQPRRCGPAPTSYPSRAFRRFSSPD